jgi:hypothetical protein
MRTVFITYGFLFGSSVLKTDLDAAPDHYGYNAFCKKNLKSSSVTYLLNLEHYGSVFGSIF